MSLKIMLNKLAMIKWTKSVSKIDIQIQELVIMMQHTKVGSFTIIGLHTK